MFCENCGANLGEDEQFCKACGAKAARLEMPLTAPFPQRASYRQRYAPWIVAGIIFFLVFAGLLYTILQPGGPVNKRVELEKGSSDKEEPTGIGGTSDATSLPSYQGFVNDFASVILPAYQKKITEISRELEQKTTAQLVVVTTKSIKPESIDAYATRLGNAWGLGQKGKDNGILLLVVVEDRKVRIAVGSGLERLLPDALLKKIIDEKILPHLRKGDYSSGIQAGAEAVYDRLLNLQTITEQFPQKDALTVPGVDASMTKMRLVFYGYINKQPKSGMATIGSDGISGIADINFLDAGGELSHDGRLVAFDSCRGPNRGIYIANLDGTGLRMVVPVSGDSCVSSSGLRWSPDDKKLSYASPTDYLLHIIQIGNRIDTPMSRTGNTDWHSWSPIGDKIVYENGKGGSRLLYIIDMNGIIRQLTYSKDFKNCESWAPDWSPDGSQIAFTSCDNKLFLIAPDGTGLQQVASISNAYSPRWSIDGNWIVYLSGRRVMRVRRNGESLTTVGTVPYFGGPFSLGPLR